MFILLFLGLIMANIGNCSIRNLKLSNKSQQAVKEVHDIMYYGNVFTVAMASIPVVQVFLSPSVTSKPVETAINITEYDWDTYADAMSGIPDMVKNQIRNVSEPMTWYTSGEEGEFWRCVTNASI